MITQAPSPASESGLHRWCLLAAPLLLCVVAAVQIVRVLWLGQTLWKGGGFGMFATTDHPGARYVKVYLLSKTGEMTALVPAMPEMREVRTTPTSANLERLAERLAAQIWVVGPQPRAAARVLAENETPQQAELPVSCSAIRIELWRTAFDPHTSQLRACKFRETTRTSEGIRARKTT